MMTLRQTGHLRWLALLMLAALALLGAHGLLHLAEGNAHAAQGDCFLCHAAKALFLAALLLVALLAPAFRRGMTRRAGASFYSSLDLLPVSGRAPPLLS